MEKTDVVTRLTIVFKNVFDNEALVLKDDLTANDVDNWDSLTHMILISDIEKEFEVKFKLKELNKMRNVGDMVDLLLQKK
ncbi:MAG: acyl carrier protein [Bacteroidales bacterium]|nr:acyl carrier protein [Bacteroidales bacterium]MCF8392055.1 acyl carrier protein [Bacteroidales bacterium]